MKQEAMFFIISAIVIILLIGFLFYAKNSNLTGLAVSEQNPDEIIHAQEMPISFEITESYIIGINIDRNLNFGAVGRGNTVTKNMNITNPFRIPVKVFINFSDDISDFASIPENDFILNPNEIKKVPVDIQAPDDAKFANYTGILRLEMRRAE